MHKLMRWGVPPLIALALYWPGLNAWFQKDDFAWLCLRGMVHGWDDLWWALFAPLAQGTIRTLSERAMFMSFYSMFGLHALPYRLLGFVTFGASLTLLNAICTELTGSRAAGFWAAILWAVNAAMAYALSWTSLYPQLLCAFGFLLSFWWLLRYTETGETRYYVAQWITFAFGFLVLELNVVYPGLALAYTLCCARRYVIRVLPMFLLSGVYTVLHTRAVSLPTTGPYKLYWDASVFQTLWAYWKIALGPNRLIYLGIYPSVWRSALALALMAGLFGFLIWKLWRREWLAAFFAAWFVTVLSPVLPLRDHLSDEYLTSALIGLAMWGAWGLISGWQGGGIKRAAAVILAAIYVCVSVPVARVTAVSFRNNSHRIERMLASIASLSRQYPAKTILLKGIDHDMFWDAIVHRPFRLFSISDVYLTADDEARIAPGPHPGYIQQFFVDPAKLDESRAVIFDVSSGEARELAKER